MAVTPTTLQDIITAARLRTDMRVSQYLTDEEFTSYINASLAQLDAILVSKFDNYKLTKVMTNVTANTDQIALPNDFLKFKGLDVQIGPFADGYYTVEPLAFQKRNDYYQGTYPGYGPNVVRYTLEGQNVVVSPPQVAAQYNYRLWYIPDFIKLSAASDTLQPYMDSQMWFDYAVSDVATKVATMQDLDTAQVLMAQTNELKEHMIKLATPNRDSGAPKAVVDTRYDNRFGGGGYGYDF